MSKQVKPGIDAVIFSMAIFMAVCVLIGLSVITLVVVF